MCAESGCSCSWWNTCWDLCHCWVKNNEAIHQKLEVQEDLDELDELAELETKLLGFIVAWYQPRHAKPSQAKPSQEGWVLYDNSSMHNHKNGSLYPSRAATRWAETRRVETSRDKTRRIKQVYCCMIICQCITIKRGHFTDNTSKNSVLYFCLVALCGYWEMTWCWEGDDLW